MRKFRKSLYIIYFLFHFALLGAAIYLFRFSGIETLLEDYDYILYIAVFGLILFFVDILADTLIVRKYEQKVRDMEIELNDAKAKLYDQGILKKPEEPAVLPPTTEEEIDTENPEEPNHNEDNY